MTALTDDMTFGIFLAPFHRVGENPTLALERDLQLLEWLDDLGYDEAWIGEHHSGGWETIASPEVFIATAAGRTSRLRLGTGVVSLPYHNPYMVANRMVLLDHLTRGPGDAGRRPRFPSLRRLHVLHRPGTPAGNDGRVPGRNPPAL